MDSDYSLGKLVGLDCLLDSWEEWGFKVEPEGECGLIKVIVEKAKDLAGNVEGKEVTKIE